MTNAIVGQYDVIFLQAMKGKFELIFLQYSVVIRVNLVQLQNQSLSDFINSQVVPFAPSTIVPQFLLSSTVIVVLKSLELFHKFNFHGSYFRSFFELRLFQRLTFRNLNVNSKQKVSEELNVQKLAPSRTQIKHELRKHFLVYFNS